MGQLNHTLLPEPPASLSRASRERWHDYTATFDFRPDELTTLEQALLQLDRAAEARAAVARDGDYVPGRFGPKPHPGLGIERNALLMYSRLIRMLGLPADAEAVVRPAPLAVKKVRANG